MKSEADIEVEKSPNRVKSPLISKTSPSILKEPSRSQNSQKLRQHFIKNQKITLIKKSQTQLFTHSTPVKQH